MSSVQIYIVASDKSGATEESQSPPAPLSDIAQQFQQGRLDALSRRAEEYRQAAEDHRQATLVMKARAAALHYGIVDLLPDIQVVQPDSPYSIAEPSPEP